MIETIGDLWEEHAAGAWVAVTTNGDVNKKGFAVMGRGVALQAAQRYPTLPIQLGDALRAGNQVHVFPALRIVTLPTKHHWRDAADLGLIERSLEQLVRWLDTVPVPRIVVPRPGCGSGGLQWRDVEPLMRHLDDRIEVICPPSEAFA
jgi:hypothetical protein